MGKIYNFKKKVKGVKPFKNIRKIPLVKQIWYGVIQRKSFFLGRELQKKEIDRQKERERKTKENEIDINLFSDLHLLSRIWAKVMKTKKREKKT